ncbi:MAG: DJ-1/PfpI family protein, partial [Planctomycetota bacterium]
MVWKNTDLLETDSGIVMKATSTFDECPKDLDVLFVPGGEFSVMRDPEVLEFLADRGARARYVTSVCGGSVVLGAAGLLQGKRPAGGISAPWNRVTALRQERSRRSSAFGSSSAMAHGVSRWTSEAGQVPSR